jgi:hypothetical protein
VKVIASPQYTQNKTIIVLSNQYPDFPLPTAYSVMFIKTVPNETTEAGTKRDSVGCVSDALKVDGYQ